MIKPSFSALTRPSNGWTLTKPDSYSGTSSASLPLIITYKLAVSAFYNQSNWVSPVNPESEAPVVIKVSHLANLENTPPSISSVFELVYQMFELDETKTSSVASKEVTTWTT